MTLKKILSKILLSTWFYISFVLTIGLLPLLIVEGGFFPECDTTAQFLPFIQETKRMFSSGVPYWSWNTYFGDNFIGSYAYYTLTRPIVWLLCLLPYRMIPIGLLISIYIEFILTAWATKYYLKLMGYSRGMSRVGSALFAFSSFMICALEYTMFYEPVLAYLLLMIMTERYLRGMSRGLAGLTVAVFAVSFINYYFMFSTLLVVAVYFLCRLGSVEQGLRLRKFIGALVSIVIGVMMSAFVLVPAMLYMSGSSRAVLDFGIHFHNIVERVRVLFMPIVTDGTMPIYLSETGHYINSANIAVVGVMFAALYVIKRPKSWLSVLTMIYLVLYLTPLNGIFTLFTGPTYTRWIYALDLSVIMCTLSYFCNHDGVKVRGKYTLVYCCICFMVYLLTVGSTIYLKGFSASFDREWYLLIIISVIFAADIVALVTLNRFKVGSRVWFISIYAGIAVIVGLQLWSFCLNRCEMGWLPRFRNIEVGKALKECEYDPTRKFTSRYDYLPRTTWIDFLINKSLIDNRPSISGYNSLHNSNVNRLFDLTSPESISVVYEPTYNRQDLAALMSVSQIESCDISVDMTEYYDDMPFSRNNGDTKVYDFKYYIPMGMAYDRYMIDGDYIDNPDFQKRHNIPRALLSSLLINADDEPDFCKYAKKSEICDSLSLDSLVELRRKHTCSTFEGDTRGFSATITLPDTLPVFFSVVADNGFKCTIDGKQSKIYAANLGLSAVIVPAGHHDIRFDYTPPGLKIGIVISILGFIIFVLILWKKR